MLFWCEWQRFLAKEIFKKKKKFFSCFEARLFEKNGEIADCVDCFGYRLYQAACVALWSAFRSMDFGWKVFAEALNFGKREKKLKPIVLHKPTLWHQ